MSLYIFDAGKTLIRVPRSRVGKKREPRRKEEQVLKPGVFEKIAKLRAGGHAIALATNQDAVAWGTISLKEAQGLVQNVADKIGGVDAWMLNPFHPMAKLSVLRGRR